MKGEQNHLRAPSAIKELGEPVSQRHKEVEQEEEDRGGRERGRAIIEMEYSRVAAFDEEEKVTTAKRVSVSYHYLYPCDLLDEALRALFKCFGHENRSDANEEQEPESKVGENPKTSIPSTPELQVEDPSDPEEAADPPSSSSGTTDLPAESNRVVRSPIGTGRGPQIN